ncbi:4'-phosphopantetheinyl transferase family protein [Pseudonocardia humida]|uniref:4'-phosphopantetheinyl transferase superfamily protein n=1 Tax=Pseudonocardia humida TaxID=2800819 RepID=A0ABT0ZYP1_9PSEU|nr:4'-phosphopantetheinyl transferase superfamily protein [Pseudonocardia humida]MCO1655826.1 4'-phosphopantetheinyl transferase superfamily protein [Pseudonocardia humida]
MCEVWWARPVDPDTAPGLVGLLDDAERARLPRFRLPADRARYLAAHALTRIVLAGAVGAAPAELRFDRSCRCGEQHGKPTLPGGPGFSLTHAGDLVGVAVHDGPVGLDVEHARPLADLAAMAAHVSSPDETVADDSAFFTLWTRKEALLKATGEGLSAPMSAITLGPTGVLAWTGAAAPTGPVWLRDLRPAAGYPAAVAGLGPGPVAVRESDGDAVLRSPTP